MDSRNIKGHKGLVTTKRNSKSENHTPTTPIHLLSQSYPNKGKSLQNKNSLKKSQSIFQKSDKSPKKNQNPSYQELGLHIRMKEKFQDLYKKIKKISANNGWDETANKQQKRFIVYPSQQIYQSKHRNKSEKIKQELIKLNASSFWEQSNSLKKEQSVSSLQINAGPFTKSSHQQSFQVKFLRNVKHKSKLASNHKSYNMSNNIRDYLSVQRISVRDIQTDKDRYNRSLRKKNHDLKQLIDHNFIQRAAQQLQTNLLFQRKKKQKQVQLAKQVPIEENSSPTLPRFNRSVYKQKKIPFQPPFQTYYYSDIIWRVAYSNQHMVQSPNEYQTKIKVYIGRGNNSRLIKSIINRRSWYQVTDKINQASVIWTQIKVANIFTWQQKHRQNWHRTERNEKNLSKQQEQIYVKNLIWSQVQQKKFKKYFQTYRHIEQKMTNDFKFRNKKLKPLNCQTTLPPSPQKSMNATNYNHLSQTKSTSFLSSLHSKIKIHNHMVNNYIIGNKKALYQTMKQYYQKNSENAFKYLPITFHICNGLEDDQYLKFLKVFYAYAKKNGEFEQENSKYNAWIVKPGQNTNRGNGIIMCLTLDAIKSILKKKQKHYDGSQKTYIIQKYIEKPLLYKKRKFDIRHFIMINCSNGMIKGYWFKTGYLRTTSSEYTLKNSFSNVHLTNDAVQKQLPDYGKYQKGNKVSYEQFNDYLMKLNPEYTFWDKIYPKMKKIANDIIKASAHNMDPVRRANNFQIFGLDFMLDSNLNVWLIEVNSNPCLEVSAPILAKIIPKLVEQTFQICVDPIYPPPLNFNPKGMAFRQNCVADMEYQLIYDERFENKSNAGSQLLNDQKLMKQEDDCFQDDGQQLTED